MITIELLTEKLNKLELTEEERNCVMAQYGLLQSYQEKLAELDDEQSLMENQIYEFSKKQIGNVLPEEEYEEFSKARAELLEKIEAKKEELSNGSESVLYGFYAYIHKDIGLDLENLKLYSGELPISGLFLLYKVQCWGVSNSPRLAKFIYFTEGEPTIVELECSECCPNKLSNVLKENYIFISSFCTNALSLYLQTLISKWIKLGEMVSIDYVFDKIGFINNNYSRFYASKVIGNNETEDAYLVGNFADYVCENGDFNAYMDMLKKEVQLPTLQLALTFGVMSPINFMLHEKNSDINNVVINICGLSSKGKTTAQKLATSVFARPEIGPRGLFINSNCSALAMVRSLADCCGMTFCIDDLTRFSKANRIDMETLIYTLEAGQSKAICRSTGSVVKPVEFHGAVITSSERFLLDRSYKEGASVRINEFCLDNWTKNAKNSENICRSITDNYGLLGPKFMKFLMSEYNRDQIFDEYDKKVKEIKKLIVTDSPYADRMINKLAIILLSAFYLDKYFKENTDYKFSYQKVKNLIIKLFDDSLRRSNDPKMILKDIVGFYNKNRKYFSLKTVDEAIAYGRITEIDGEKCIALTKEGRLAFAKSNYSLDNCKLTALFEAGYLVPEIDHVKSNSNYARRVHFARKQYRCTVVKIDEFNI